MWGGSSSLNAMMYIRGHAYDYDRWEKEGAEGWSYADCLPYFRKSQTHELGKLNKSLIRYCIVRCLMYMSHYKEDYAEIGSFGKSLRISPLAIARDQHVDLEARLHRRFLSW